MEYHKHWSVSVLPMDYDKQKAKTFMEFQKTRSCHLRRRIEMINKISHQQQIHGKRLFEETLSTKLGSRPQSMASLPVIGKSPRDLTPCYRPRTNGPSHHGSPIHNMFSRLMCSIRTNERFPNLEQSGTNSKPFPNRTIPALSDSSCHSQMDPGPPRLCKSGTTKSSTLTVSTLKEQISTTSENPKEPSSIAQGNKSQWNSSESGSFIVATRHNLKTTKENSRKCKDRAKCWVDEATVTSTAPSPDVMLEWDVLGQENGGENVSQQIGVEEEDPSIKTKAQEEDFKNGSDDFDTPRKDIGFKQEESDMVNIEKTSSKDARVKFLDEEDAVLVNDHNNGHPIEHATNNSKNINMENGQILDNAEAKIMKHVVVSLADLKDKPIKLPGLICPSSESRSREAAVKHWLNTTSFPAAIKTIPLW